MVGQVGLFFHSVSSIHDLPPTHTGLVPGSREGEETGEAQVSDNRMRKTEVEKSQEDQEQKTKRFDGAQRKEMKDWLDWEGVGEGARLQEGRRPVLQRVGVGGGDLDREDYSLPCPLCEDFGLLVAREALGDCWVHMS